MSRLYLLRLYPVAGETAPRRTSVDGIAAATPLALVVPEPDRTQPKDRIPGMPIERPAKGLFAVLRGLLALFALIR